LATIRVKTRIYEQVARIGRAAASPARLELLDLLAQAPRTVEDLASQITQSVANTSHHLQVLRRARLVEADRDGNHVSYRLATDRVAEFMLGLRGLAHERLTELDQVMRVLLEPDRLEGLDCEVLLQRVRRGDVTLLDVRPRAEYLAGHIPGAISVPIPELKARLRDLSKRRDVVAYCRGPYCVMARDAVQLLRRHGFHAHRMELGVAEWRSRGWAIVRPEQPGRQRKTG
jgi:rhodanese-related sulfurtransferase/DNA-binding transcriptional ArsR family regulator